VETVGVLFRMLQLVLDPVLKHRGKTMILIWRRGR